MYRTTLIILALFTACGGGSDDSASSDVEGVWRGNLRLISDQCSIRVDPLAERHEVSLHGDDVTMISTDGRRLEGTMLNGDSFQVEISDGQAFPTIDRVTYTGIFNGTADVEVSHIWSRPGGCETVWQGRMLRE